MQKHNKRSSAKLGVKNIVKLGAVCEVGSKGHWDITLHVWCDNGREYDIPVRPGPTAYFESLPDREIARTLRDRIISCMNSGFAVLVQTEKGEEQLNARDFGYAAPTPKRFRVFGEKKEKAA